MDTHAHVPKPGSALKHRGQIEPAFAFEKKWIANLETAGLSTDLKTLYRSNMDRIGSGSTDWFDPAFHDAAARKLYLALDELYYDQSEVLLPLYKKLQPMVHAAVDAK